jgi:hypothetical protein
MVIGGDASGFVVCVGREFADVTLSLSKGGASRCGADPSVTSDRDGVVLSLAKGDRALLLIVGVDFTLSAVIRSGSLPRLRGFGGRRSVYESTWSHVHPRAHAGDVRRFAFWFRILGGCITLT